MEEGLTVTKTTEVKLDDLYCPYCGGLGTIEQNVQMRFDKPLDQNGAQAIVHLQCVKYDCKKKFLIVHLGP